MNESTDNLIQLYAGKGVFVDTNLLLLWFVGAIDKQLIPRFKRTGQFVPEDFDMLDLFLAQFSRRVTTPNVLTEVSNLAGQLGSHAELFFKEVFCKAVQEMTEEYVESRSLSGEQQLGRFGLTDCAIMAVVKGKYLLLTDDFRLSQYLGSVGGDAINFNHIRVATWL